ncbi:MAG: hypothetical protein ACRD32_06740 [Nitrososphaerales archaeon]
MSEKSNLASTVILGLWISICVLAVASALLGIIFYKQKPNIPVVEHPIIVQAKPMFKRGDCFNGLLEKEIWDASFPDGIIERVGKNNYLILYKMQANKRGRDKIGLPMSIATFDQYHIRADCPKTWVNHRSSNESSKRYKR